MVFNRDARMELDEMKPSTLQYQFTYSFGDSVPLFYPDEGHPLSLYINFLPIINFFIYVAAYLMRLKPYKISTIYMN